jgi:hypothetical protein
MDVETRSRQVSPGVVGWMMARHPRSRRPQNRSAGGEDPFFNRRKGSPASRADFGPVARHPPTARDGTRTLGRDTGWGLLFRPAAISSHGATDNVPGGEEIPGGNKIWIPAGDGDPFSIGGKDPRQTESGRLTRNRDQRTQRRDIGTGLTGEAERAGRDAERDWPVGRDTLFQ